jgi:hypothetical protein
MLVHLRLADVIELFILVFKVNYETKCILKLEADTCLEWADMSQDVT